MTAVDGGERAESPELRVLLVDDEPLARRGIAQLVAQHEGAVIVGECGDGRSAVAAIAEQAPDVVFLDIQMPELDGFGVVEAVGSERMPATIFLTAYAEFAVDAFGVDAVDYLVKPVSASRFEDAMVRARRWLRLTRGAEGGGAPGGRAEPRASGDESAELPEGPQDRLIVPTSAGALVLEAAEIDWIGAEDYYAALHAYGRRHLVRASLATLEARLDGARFARAHRGALVNLARVRAVRTVGDGRYAVTLRDGTVLPVSRRRWGAFTRALEAWTAQGRDAGR